MITLTLNQIEHIRTVAREFEKSFHSGAQRPEYTTAMLVLQSVLMNHRIASTDRDSDTNKVHYPPSIQPPATPLNNDRLVRAFETEELAARVCALESSQARIKGTLARLREIVMHSF